MMRQIIFIILALLVPFNTVLGGRTKEIEISFDANEFSFVRDNGITDISTSKYAIQYIAKDTDPGLPYVIVHVLISGDEKYEGIEVQSSEILCQENITVGYNPHYSVITEKAQPLNAKRNVSYNLDSYPAQSKRVLYGGTHVVDGYKYVTLLVSPFSYKCTSKSLFIRNSLKLKLLLSSDPNVSATCGRAMRNVVQSLVINGNDMESLYPKSSSARSSNDVFDYLIITSEGLKGAFQRLANWKNRKGVRTRIITDEEIADSFSAIDHQGFWNPIVRYKRAIKHYKDNNEIKYVLLAGDASVVPSVACYVEYDTLNAMAWDVTPCDLYYACTGSSGAVFEWNCATSDGRIGSYLDRPDYYPNVIVTRLLASSVSEANILIDRIIEYESNPNDNIGQKKILMSGAEFKSTATLGDGTLESDAQHKGELILDHIRDHWQYCNGFKLYDTGSSHPLGASYDLTAQHLAEQLSNGHSIFHIDTHGSARMFGLEKINMVADSFAISDAMSFTNPWHTLVVTSACRTNAFDSIPCLSRTMMSNPNGGIIAYWGHSCNVIGISDEREFGPVDFYNLTFYEKLFSNHEKHFGELAMMTKLRYITQYDSISNDHNMPYTNPYRWLLYSMNPIGDPEMPIFTATPQTFQPHNIYQNYDGTIYVNVYPTADRVCIMSLDDKGESYYSVETWTGTDADLDLPTGHDYSICFTKAGYKPYVLNVYMSGIIQNDTIANDAVVISDYVQIGRDVTYVRPYGDVLLERGEMTIMSPQGAYIKNNFHVKKGAKLTIDPSIQEIYYP